MLSWLACQLAPPIPDLRDAVPPELPDPSPHDELRERAREVLAELATVPFGDRADANPYKVLLAMACRELVTREADQHPDTAGRTPNYAGMPFEPLEIPAGDGVRLTGHHSIGAPGCPVLVVVHGLFDSHTSVYVVELAETIRRWGFHVVTLDLRDHGRLRGRPPQASLGRAEGADLFAAARTLSRAEGVSVGILGLSYGGHCAVRAAYEASVAGEAQVLRGGVMAVGAPLDIHEAVLAFDDRSRLPEPPTFWDRRIANGTFRQMVRHLRLRSAEKGHTPAAGSEYESFIRDVVIPAVPISAFWWQWAWNSTFFSRLPRSNSNSPSSWSCIRYSSIMYEFSATFWARSSRTNWGYSSRKVSRQLGSQPMTGMPCSA